MPDIYLSLEIRAPIDLVFDAVSTPEGLSRWWTKETTGIPEPGATYMLNFGPGYDWEAEVLACTFATIEWVIRKADAEWVGTRVGLRLVEKEGCTQVSFYHTGWPSLSDHYRVSCYCWAMYLRVLKRFLEHGEVTPYERRLIA